MHGLTDLVDLWTPIHEIVRNVLVDTAENGPSDIAASCQLPASIPCVVRLSSSFSFLLSCGFLSRRRWREKGEGEWVGGKKELLFVRRLWTSRQWASATRALLRSSTYRVDTWAPSNTYRFAVDWGHNGPLTICQIVIKREHFIALNDSELVQRFPCSVLTWGEPVTSNLIFLIILHSHVLKSSFGFTLFSN